MASGGQEKETKNLIHSKVEQSGGFVLLLFMDGGRGGCLFTQGNSYSSLLLVCLLKS